MRSSKAGNDELFENEMQFDEKEIKKCHSQQRAKVVEKHDSESEKSGHDDLVDDILNNLHLLINLDETIRPSRIQHLRNKSRF